MRSLSSWLSGIGWGAVTMYFLDPVAGARRRSLVRDQFHALLNDTQTFVDRGARDLSNRAVGLIAEARAGLSDGRAPDPVIADRVRATIGRYVSHPRAIEVNVENGGVILRGDVLAHEARRLISAVSSVRGVSHVENQLTVHEQADISSLQGGRERPGGEPYGFMENNWTPGIRLLGVTAGLAMMTNCVLRRSPQAIILGTLGCGLFTRAVVNQPTRQWLGRGQPPRTRTASTREPAASRVD